MTVTLYRLDIHAVNLQGQALADFDLILVPLLEDLGSDTEGNSTLVPRESWTTTDSSGNAFFMIVPGLYEISIGRDSRRIFRKVFRMPEANSRLSELENLDPSATRPFSGGAKIGEYVKDIRVDGATVSYTEVDEEGEETTGSFTTGTEGTIPRQPGTGLSLDGNVLNLDISNGNVRTETTIDTDDLIAFSDESSTGDVTKNISFDNFKIALDIPEAAEFDLHDDVPTRLSTLADLDRFVVSDESTSGDPNRHVRSEDVADYVWKKPSADLSNAEQEAARQAIGAGTGSDFDLHDDVSTELTDIADDDRLLITDESSANNPNRYAEASTISTYVRGEIVIGDIPNIPWSKITGNPSLFNRRGAYANNTAYAVGDVVTYSNHLYYVAEAVPNTNTTAPSDGSTWVLLSADPGPTQYVKDISVTGNQMTVTETNAGTDTDTTISIGGTPRTAGKGLKLDGNSLDLDVSDSSLTTETSIADADLIPFADESSAGDQTKNISWQSLKGQIPSFDIHDDISMELGSIADDDRIAISDESSTGDVMKYVEASDLATYVIGKAPDATDIIITTQSAYDALATKADKFYYIP